MDVMLAESNEEIQSCFEALKALRPGLVEEGFVERVRGMISRGYRLAYVKANGEVAAVCGYRFMDHLYLDRVLHVDDLSTLERHRRNGYARRLLDYVKDTARAHGCREVRLHSGVGAHRSEAHRRYLTYGFNITSFHFALEVRPPSAR